MFTGNHDSHYWYSGGVNWRAFAAFFIGCVPTIPGFIGTFGFDVPAGASRIYEVGWLFSILVGAFAYFVLAVACPNRSYREARAAKFEEWAVMQKELLDRVPQTSPTASTEELDDKDLKDADVANVHVAEVRPGA